MQPSNPNTNAPAIPPIRLIDDSPAIRTTSANKANTAEIEYINAFIFSPPFKPSF